MRRRLLPPALWILAGVLLAAVLAPLGQADHGSDDVVSVRTITPCRLVDTRTDDVDPRARPLGPEETVTFPVVGSRGRCAIDDDPVGVILNVTAVAPTAETHVVFFPAGEDRPLASNLNGRAGDPPQPNQVTVDLGDGSFSVYNRSGTVHLVVDVVAVLERHGLVHDHDERYLTPTEGDRRYLTPTEGDGRYATPEDVAAAAVDLRGAVVEEDGTLVRSVGAVSGAARVSTGNYDVSFPRDITDCVFTATIGRPGSGGVGNATIDVSVRVSTTDTVHVDVEDGAGTQLDRPFHLQVLCP